MKVKRVDFQANNLRILIFACLIYSGAPCITYFSVQISFLNSYPEIQLSMSNSAVGSRTRRALTNAVRNDKLTTLPVELKKI